MSLVKLSSLVLLFWTRKVNARSSWLSFSKIIIIVSCVVWDEQNSISKWFSVQIQFSTLSKRHSGGTTHSQSILVCLDCKREGFNRSVDFDLNFAWALLYLPLCKSLRHCSLLTQQLHWDEQVGHNLIPDSWRPVFTKSLLCLYLHRIKEATGWLGHGNGLLALKKDPGD